MKDIEWQKQHLSVIKDFLDFINTKSSEFILKGGTALMLCYGLDRFSEDINFDGTKGNIGTYIDLYCRNRNFSYRTAKDMDTVKRCMINYGNIGKPLKVELSLRKKTIDPDEINIINGIKVYKINSLCAMKVNAYVSRDKIRDLYDLSFICNNYWEQLSVSVKILIREAVSYKGVEQFDYLIKEQKDDLIDSSKLAEDFLRMYDRLGLLTGQKEIQMINNITTGNKNKKTMDYREM